LMRHGSDDSATRGIRNENHECQRSVYAANALRV
jgi:hypothetical protein